MALKVELGVGTSCTLFGDAINKSSQYCRIQEGAPELTTLTTDFSDNLMNMGMDSAVNGKE